MTFAADYRRLIAPRLAKLARFQGLLIVIGDQSFSAAHQSVMAEAYRLGAAHLPEDVRLDLDDRVADWLIAAVEAALPAWEAAEAMATRVADQITRHEAKHIRNE